jgi:hypothetical protein
MVRARDAFTEARGRTSAEAESAATSAIARRIRLFLKHSDGIAPMKLRVRVPSARQIPSHASIATVAILSGLGIFSIAILLQWLIYDGWLHDSGPLRLVGSVLTMILTAVFVFRWQEAKRREKIAVLKRLETIKWMNDRIRNSLQAIECVVFANHRHVTNPVRDAVDAIEGVLEEMLSETHSSAAAPGIGDGAGDLGSLRS